MGNDAVEVARLQHLAENNEPFLPRTLSLWKEMYMLDRGSNLNCIHLVWKYLSNVFLSHGYELYVPRKHLDSDTFSTMVYPAGYMESIYGVDGTQCAQDDCGTLGSDRYMCSFYPYAAVWPARNKSGREVVIKVVSDSQDSKGLTELRVMQHLARHDLRTHPRNRTVPFLELIEHEQFTFAVLPRWTDFPQREIRIPKTAIECCVQMTEGLAFLHENHIAHLDISPENVMINFFGYAPLTLSPVVEHLPIKYAFIDFGESVFLDGHSGSLAPPRDYAPRPTSAPEVSSGKPFDPFAADVYQTAMFMLEQFYDLTGFTPEFLSILQAMTRSPDTRLSMAEAHRSLAVLRDSWISDPHPEVLDVIQRPLNKYTKTFLNTRRPFPGSVSMPANDDEAKSLRERMQRDQQDEKRRVARWPSQTAMLRVDPIRGTIGCVHGNHAKHDIYDE
ncbi:kinase-like domain-containing protein [Schizophyllum amplum]|uniref:Kinase-like domain-containing protein n=1 Tax=Schizophyllum amplum TaxID=97359 RepID=A0A550CA55_9AGAR|nr:kinase-like domain-containing protein [Auriculariopsis ampla]